MTNHAQTRFAQRGLSAQDVSLLLDIGSETRDGFMVLERDFQSYEREEKNLLQRVRRMIGKHLMVEGDTVITAYHCNKRKEKSVLQNIEKKG